HGERHQGDKDETYELLHRIEPPFILVVDGFSHPAQVTKKIRAEYPISFKIRPYSDRLTPRIFLHF
ncbi:MAG: hypothetical protein IKV90_04650, partial [Clostridia bacterium]|nr:hypothetical protein [Clostridia bacterium]